MSRLKRFLTSSEQRTYCGDQQNPLARLEELRRRQSSVVEDPEYLLRRLSERERERAEPKLDLAGEAPVAAAYEEK